MSFANTQVQWYNTSATATTTTQTFVVTNTIGTGWIGGGISTGYPQDVVTFREVDAPVKLVAGTTYSMPDGSKVKIDHDGGYTIDDKYAKVIYRASRVRDFNPFLNASDLLEQYIEELVPLGIRQDQVLHLEIEGFIYWLIHRAAERDGDEPPKDVPRLPTPQRRLVNRCRTCGRFIFHSYVLASIFYCSPEHVSIKLERLGYGS